MGLQNLKHNIKEITANPNQQKEGAIIKTPNGQPMSLYQPAKLGLITLHANQFVFPSSFLVHSCKRVELKEIDEHTGFQKKDDNGKAIGTGKHVVRLQLIDGDSALLLVKSGNAVLDGLSTIQCTIMKDIPLQNFSIDDTLITLVNPNVMLSFDGNNGFTRLVLQADDYKEADVAND